MSQYRSSLNPPEPGNNATENLLGKNLMNLVRTFEKSLKQQSVDIILNEDVLKRILLLLTSMRDLFLRKGLLQGDITKADALVAQSSSSSSTAVGTKRKRRHQCSMGGQLKVQVSTTIGLNSAVDDGDGILLNSSSTTDEILIMTSIHRILNPTTPSINTQESTYDFVFPWVAIRAAVDVLSAVCCGMGNWNHPIDNILSENPCRIIESQIIESFSSNVLNGLAKIIKSLVSIITDDKSSPSIILSSSENKQEILSTLSSCFTCYTWFIITLGTKLSRSTNINMELKSLVKDMLWIDHVYRDEFYFSESFTGYHPLLNSLCNLVSVLPLVGDSNSTPPSKLWNHYIQSIASSYHILIQSFFPKLSSSSSKQERNDSVRSMNLNSSMIPFDKEILEWISCIPTHLPSQKQRLNAFIHRSYVYSCLLVKFLSMESYDTKAMTYFTSASLPIKQLLDLCDSLLTFSSHAERRYLNTKSRLRDVIVDQGFFSVQSAVSIGNEMKYLGLNLFQAVISIMNQSCLSHGKRLLQSCLVSLKSCSSLNVRKIVDPTYSDAISNLVQADKHNQQGERKWLQTSIVVRTRALQTVMSVVKQIGSNAVFEINIFVQLINILAGCVLEQILGHESGVVDEHWGTLPERVNLVTTGLLAMSSITNVCGGFMPLVTRETIESVALSCINHLGKYQNIPLIFTFSSTKIAVLQLSLDCISCPWPDGCASSLISTLYSVTFAMRHDRDDAVSVIAYKVFAVCNAFMTPRAPPLVLGVRNLSHDGDQKRIDSSIATLSYDSLISGIISDMKQKREAMGGDVIKGEKIGDTKKDGSLDKDIGIILNEHIREKFQDETDKCPVRNKLSEDVPQTLNGDKVLASPAVGGSIPQTTKDGDVGSGYVFRAPSDLHGGKLKSDDVDKFERKWAGANGMLKEISSDDDEELPDIIDGDPD